MNYTKNYRLPQWVKEDRIMMDDFNAMNTSIESGLTKTAAQAARAEQSAQNAESSAANAYSPGNKPYVVGSYTGTGREMPFDLGFRPSFLIISGTHSVFPTGQSAMNSYNLFTAGNILSNCVTFTDTGFVLHKLEENVYPKLVDGRRYDYIAFR